MVLLTGYWYPEFSNGKMLFISKDVITETVVFTYKFSNDFFYGQSRKYKTIKG